jgi:tRNA (adenine57-N1/adenine58-N1)-methyltransferase catalytic subunit
VDSAKEPEIGPVGHRQPVVAPSGEPLKAGDHVVLADDRGHHQLACLVAGNSLHMNAGAIPCAELIGKLPGRRVKTGKGKEVTVTKPTLEEYMLMMPRAAQIITPKDAAYIVHWADVFPGATVVEAGVGSGALTLSLLRAVGEAGRVIGFEQRVEFANRAQKNVDNWREPLAKRLELRVADVHAGLGALSKVDRVILDLAEPWLALPGAATALVADGFLVAYLPNIRQVDRLLHAILDRQEFEPPEVVEAWVRPWIADRERLRPVHKILAFTGFLVRTRRRGESEEEIAAFFRRD